MEQKEKRKDKAKLAGESRPKRRALNLDFLGAAQSYGGRGLGPQWQKEKYGKKESARRSSSKQHPIHKEQENKSGLTEAELSRIDEQFRDHIANSLRHQVTHCHLLPSKEARCVQLPEDLHPALRQALLSNGYSTLYSHQAEAREKLNNGNDLIVTTPTSSGKSLCFNVGIFEILLPRKDSASALYLFPLTALAKDQWEKIQALNEALPPQDRLRVVSLSGERTVPERMNILRNGVPHIVVMTPDMLHFQLERGKVGQRGWENWREFITRLRFCVMDEAHTYSGVFGCHVSNLIRRLCLNMDAMGGQSFRIRFVLASATVGNACEMAAKLIGREEALSTFRLKWIANSGAKTPQRIFLTLAPQKSPIETAAKIVLRWIEQRWSCIVFCQTINKVNQLTEVIQNHYAREYASQVRSFYAALPSRTKQRILDEVKSGAVRGIISTSALEAGVDIPALDCCLILGYPGNKMSLWQRIGRAGRIRAGLSLFIPEANNPLDRYYSTHPQILLNNEMEDVMFNNGYPTILAKHLWCACAESGIPDAKLERRFGPMARKMITFLEEQTYVKLEEQIDKGMVWIAKGSPHSDLQLRGSSSQQIKAVWEKTNTIVETMSERHALKRLFPGAIFQSQDRQGRVCHYSVLSLDLHPQRLVAMLRRLDVKPLFKVFPLVNTRLRVLDVWQEKRFSLAAGELVLTHGWGETLMEVSGYEVSESKQKNKSKQFNKHGEAPEITLAPSDLGLASRFKYDPFKCGHEAPYLRFSLTPPAKEYLQRCRDELVVKLKEAEGTAQELDNYERMNSFSAEFVALHTLLHQLMAIVPLLLLSAQDVEEAQIDPLACEGFLTDSCEGGTGVCEAIFQRFPQFMEKAAALAESSCPNCKEEDVWGCAACTFHPACPIHNDGLVRWLGVHRIYLLPENTSLSASSSSAYSCSSSSCSSSSSAKGH